MNYFLCDKNQTLSLGREIEMSTVSSWAYIVLLLRAGTGSVYFCSVGLGLLGSGSGFAILGFWAQNSLAYNQKYQLRVIFKFWALSGLVENWARAFSVFRLMYCTALSPGPTRLGLG